jgi:hypothetical protein
VNGRNDAEKADASPLTKKRREGRHEVLIQRDGRWIIESVVMGEGAAVAHAEALLAADEAIAPAPISCGEISACWISPRSISAAPICANAS